MSSEIELLRPNYAEFNRREIDSVLVAMHPEVDWPNSLEGSRVYGHQAVREYWTRQFQMLNPTRSRRDSAKQMMAASSSRSVQNHLATETTPLLSHAPMCATFATVE